MDIGSINNELLKFERSCEETQSSFELPVAKYMMVFMVKGLFIDLNFPYAQFARHQICCFHLYGKLFRS